MSTSNIPSKLPAVERLIQRIASAEKTQQKDIRISIDEAKDITNELALMTTKLSSTISEIHNLLKNLSKSTEEIDVKFDGGSF
jgi:methyl-accepting chemotaxis protein